jgi:dTDP-L-rhamnose 4-epimerase
MTRLLVTGGLGFIGSQVVRAAIAAGHTVRVLDRAAGAVPIGVELMRDDLTRPGVADSALRGVDAVVHLAAKVGLGVDLDDAPDYTDTNVTGTARLLAGMARAGIDRLVLSSSMVVYGEGAYRDALGPVAVPPRAVADLEAGRFDPVGADGVPLVPELVTEEATPDPRNVYAVSKLAQEQLASAWARAVDGRVASLRYHNVYGPGMPRDTPYAGVAALFRSELAHGRPPRVFEDGGQRRDFVHVRDVAAANLAALDWVEGCEAGCARAFNVGSGVVRTVGELATALARAAGGPEPVVTGQYRLGDVRHITASSERARRELGWSAVMPFEDGMREFAFEAAA